MVETTNQIFSLLTIAGQILAAAIIIYLLIYRGRQNQDSLVKFFGAKAILFSFIVALMAVLGSLFYSEIAGYAPCKLCWFQRIFIYPQVVLFAVALIIKDKNNIRVYALTLSLIGALIALYQYLLQIGLVPSIGCPSIGYSSACSQRFFVDFGYITIPMMSLTTFVLISLFMFVSKIYEKIIQRNIFLS